MSYKFQKIYYTILFSLFLSFIPCIFKCFFPEIKTFFNQNIFIVHNVFDNWVWLKEFGVTSDIKAITNCSKNVIASLQTIFDILNEGLSNGVTDNKDDLNRLLDEKHDFKLVGSVRKVDANHSALERRCRHQLLELLEVDWVLSNPDETKLGY